MDIAARNEILTVVGNILREADNVSNQTVALHGVIISSASPMRAWEHLMNVRNVIWEDGDVAWENIKAYIHQKDQQNNRDQYILRMHEVIHALGYSPETYGELRTRWFGSDAKARATAKEPYAMMQKCYAEAGEHAVMLISQLMLDATKLSSMHYRMERALVPLQAHDGQWMSNLLHDAAGLPGP